MAINITINKLVVPAVARNKRIYQNPSNTVQLTGSGSSSGGGGGLTSVGLTLPNIFTSTNNPLISNGDIGITLVAQTKNKFLASPSTAGGVPTFRTIVAEDLPSGGNYSSWFTGFSATSNKKQIVGNNGTFVTGSDYKGLIFGNGGSPYVQLALTEVGEAIRLDISTIGLQPLDGDLTAIAALSGTTGYLKKTAANTWTLDSGTGGGGDNYEAFTFNINTPSTRYDINSKNSAGTYRGIKLASGNGITLGSSASENERVATIGVALTSSLTSLSANVPLTTASTYYTVDSISLPTGKHLVMGQMAISATAYAIVTGKLHTGTTNYSSGITTIGSAGLGSGSAEGSICIYTIISVDEPVTLTMSAASNTDTCTVNRGTTLNNAGNTATKLSYIKLADV